MRSWLRRHRGYLLFLVLLGVFRTAVADWNPIPSGSMRPTLLEGDLVFVNRLAYDLKVPLTDHSLAHLGEPQRGDVVTFSSPLDGTRLIKRLVALPGDVVSMRDGVLSINGVEAAYTDVTVAAEPSPPGVVLQAARTVERLGESHRSVQFLSRGGRASTFAPVTVPPGHYFMLGDNRDDSADSRYIGTVPRALLIGRAERVLVSLDAGGSWLPRPERLVAPLR